MGEVKYSYSRVETYNKCPWKYKLKYIDLHYVESNTLALELGTLVHFIEEHISYALMKGETPDYDKLRDDFYNINIPKTGPQDMDGGQFGINILKKRYASDFFSTDEEGNSYATRCEQYAREGIYRQEEFLKAHPSYQIFDVEKYFEFTFEGHIIKGYIDRIWYDTATRQYIIDDIKTKNKFFDEKDTKTPMQHCIYAMALKNALGLFTEPTIFFYDLPFVNARQPIGTMGCIDRARKKLHKLFAAIDGDMEEIEDQWKPAPSPLCYYCEFGGLNPKLTAEGRHLCPYYSLWKPGSKFTGEVLNDWKGISRHEDVMDHFLNEQCTNGQTIKQFDLSNF